MNVSVGREFREFVRGKVESGDDASASKVMAEFSAILEYTAAQGLTY